MTIRVTDLWLMTLKMSLKLTILNSTAGKHPVNNLIDLTKIKPTILKINQIIIHLLFRKSMTTNKETTLKMDKNQCFSGIKIKC